MRIVLYLVCTCALAGVAAFSAIEISSSDTVENATASLDFAPIEATTVGRRSEAVLRLDASRSVLALAPPWSGLVTGIIDSPLGKPIGEGDRLVEVDGVWRIATRLERPFWRSIGLGDSGADVAQMREMLWRFGYMEDADLEDLDRPVAWRDRESIRRFAQSIGVVDRVDSFDPGWVVRIERGDPLDSLDVTVGKPVPEPGTAIALSGLQVTSAFMEPKPVEAGSIQSLLIDGEEVAVSVDSLGRVDFDQDALPLLEGEPSIAVAVTVLYVEVAVLEVPASALVVNEVDPGSTCVLVESSRAQDEQALTRVVVSGVGEPPIGRAYLDAGSLSAGSRVALNPLVEGNEPRC